MKISTALRRWIHRVAISGGVVRGVCWSLACLVILLASESPSLGAGETLGPEKGTLVIVGGGDRNNLVFRHFVKLAGGKDARLVIVPTASSSDSDYDYMGHRAAKYAREELGMPHVTVVHTHDRAEADTGAFVRPIRAADAVWFSGGRQWRIVDSYLRTLTERAFRNVLERGGVVGGSSAGASIQGSFLVRGDTTGSDILIGDHQHGLGYLTNSAIDQHVIPRNRQNGLIEVLTDPDGKMEPSINRHALLGIGIDEATGIVVRGNQFEVVGKKNGVVLIYDRETWTPGTPDSGKYVTLWRGAKYNLKERIVFDRGQAPRSMAPTRLDQEQTSRENSD